MKLADGAWEGSDDLELFHDLFKVARGRMCWKLKNRPLQLGSRFSGASVEGAECRCAIPFPLPPGEGYGGEGFSMADAHETFYPVEIQRDYQG